MQYYCQLHSLQYTQVCLQSDCKRKGPLCDMCINSHDQHVIQNLEVYINDYSKYLAQDNQGQILIKLEQMKTFFHNKLSQLQIDINSVDEKRKKDLIRQMKTEKMSIQQFQSKVIELIHRDQLKDREYLESFLEQIQEIEIQIKQSFSQLPTKLVQQQNHPQPQSQSQSIINYKSQIPSDVIELSPQLSNRSKSKEPIFQQKPSSISPIRKQLLLQQRDLMPVGSFNNSKLKNYFTEQDPQQSARSKQDTQTSFKITKPFEVDRSSSKNKNGDVNLSKQKSPNSSFDMKTVEPFRLNQMVTQSIDILPKSPQESKSYDKSPKNGRNPTTPTSQFKFIQQQEQLNQTNQSLNKGYFTNQQKSFSEQQQKENSLPFKFQQQQQQQQQPESSQVEETPLFFIPKKGQTEEIFQHSNNELHENQTNEIFKQNEQDQFSLPNRQSSQTSSINIQNTKPDLDLSVVSLKSNIAQPIVKLTSNLPNPFKIENNYTLRAHEKSIKNIIQMDDTRLISCSKDLTIKIWDKVSKQHLLTLKDHTDHVLCVAFSRKKRIIASGSVDKTLRLWKPNPHYSIFCVCEGHQDRIRCVEFIGNFVASGSDDTTVKIWSLEGKLEYSLKTIGRVNSLLADKQTLIIASGKSIILFDTNLKTKQNEVQAHSNQVQCLTLEYGKNQSEGILISGSKDNTIKLWNYPKLIELRTLVEDYPIQSLCFSLSGHLIVGMMGYQQEGKISIWKIETVPQKVQEISQNPYGCNKILYDGKILYSAHENRRIEFYTITAEEGN